MACWGSETDRSESRHDAKGYAQSPTTVLRGPAPPDAAPVLLPDNIWMLFAVSPSCDLDFTGQWGVDGAALIRQQPQQLPFVGFLGACAIHHDGLGDPEVTTAAARDGLHDHPHSRSSASDW